MWVSTHTQTIQKYARAPKHLWFSILLIYSGDYMPTFVEVYENICEWLIAQEVVTDEINKILSSLQKKGAKILDVKVSLAEISDGEHRTYLILYEAEKPIKFESQWSSKKSLRAALRARYNRRIKGIRVIKEIE